MDPNVQYYGYTPAATPQSSGSGAKRIILLVFGVIGILSLLVAGGLLIFSKPSSSPKLIKLSAMHQEIGRVAELGLKSERARASTKQLAANIKLTSADNLAVLTQYLKNDGTALEKSQLNSENNKQIDDLLEEAEQLNNYDGKFIEIMRELLSQTNSETANAIESSQSEKLKQVLNQVGTKNQLLIESLGN